MITTPQGSKSTFYKYRFQILPTAKSPQLNLFPNDIEGLKKHKNELFKETLLNGELNFHRSKSEIVHKFEYQQDEFFVLRLGAEKRLNVDDKNFEKTEMPTYPNLLVIIDNDPQEQYLYIEDDRRAFTHPDVVANILAGTFNKFLNYADLSFFISPIFDESDFWSIVRKHQNQIESITFEFIRPNMSNISSSLDKDLKAAQEDLNSTKSKVEFRAPPKGSLDVTPENATVNGLVDYTSKGGGEITLKAKGVRKKISTKEHVETFEINEIELTGTSRDVSNFISKLRNV